MATDTSRDEYLFEVKESPGKGLGVFVKADIPRGTRILSESPVLTQTSCVVNCKQLQDDVARLSRVQTDEFVELNDCGSEQNKRITSLIERGNVKTFGVGLGPIFRATLGIWLSNVFSLVEDKTITDTERFLKGLCLIGSRFNHSCTPNTSNTYNTTAGKMNFHTLRSVKKGEELAISYMPIITVPYADRNRKGKRKRQSRAVVSKLEDTLVQLAQQGLAMNGSLIDKCLKIVETIVKHNEREGLQVKLRPTYVWATYLCLAGGDLKMALFWAIKTVLLDLWHYGEDYHLYHEDCLVVRQLRPVAHLHGCHHVSTSLLDYISTRVRPLKQELQRDVILDLPTEQLGNLELVEVK
ncbi:hypothetical protein NA57DRAFT_78584 [Rhizodiscina lignyota]|uniref:SET domain-containing protein n=1 Tax=Rhizodiscina lignyota TaxID=1504668 RepID=A0A9P4I890_9PEZI|nr:hypothetical protein NA57DRAFT_78584 [Rhizodiscina lignyota]